MSFYQKLYEGRYAPIHETLDLSEEQKARQKVMADKEKELRETLSEAQKMLFEGYQEAKLECEYDQQLLTFRQGFEIGAEFHKEYQRDDLPS